MNQIKSAAMPLARPLPDIQRELRHQLTDDLKAVLDSLQALLPENAPKQDEIFLLLGRYNDARRLERQGVATGEEVRRIENQLRRDLLIFINELTEADFDADAQKNKPGGAKQGMLLYQVPHLMTLDDETRCTVRIALDRDVLFENLKIIDHTEERLLKKISKSMQVELADPSGGRNFAIRGTSKAVQTIDLDGEEYTEWRFYVTPLREGQYILEVKVAVIELVDGEKELRERVLEEEVQIISRNAAPAAAPNTPFKAAGEALAFAQVAIPPPAGTASAFPGAPQSTPAFEPAAAPVAAPAPRRGKGLGRALPLFLIFLLAGSSAVWAVPAPVRDWWWAGLRNTAEAYAEYIADHKNDPDPGTRRRVEQAYFKIADKTGKPTDLNNYLDQYPEGDPALREKAIQKIETLEIEALENIQRQPEPESIRQFLQNFPDSKRLPEVSEAAAAKPEVLQQVQAELTQAATEQTRRRSPASSTPQETPQMSPAEAADWAAAEAANTARAYVDFVNKYPKTAKLPEARARINALKPAMTPEEQAWADATLANAPQAYIYFVQKYPKSRHTTEARERIRTYSLSIKDQKRLEAEAAARLVAEQEAERQRLEQQETQRKAQEAANQQPSNQQPSNRSGLTMVSVQGGTFTMGCVDGRNEDCSDNEKPAHPVTLSGFQIGKYEVTQADWRAIMGTNPSYFKNCDDCPVERVSWDDIQDFLQKLNARYPGKNYRLPTEAEWEYAARGGHKMPSDISMMTAYPGGNDIGKVAWYSGNSGDKTHPVGGKTPNVLGLYDMSGNVYEWCSDCYGDYPAEAQKNPKGPIWGYYRVQRGGSRYNDPPNCHVEFRGYRSPGDRYNYIGFRLARTN